MLASAVLRTYKERRLRAAALQIRCSEPVDLRQLALEILTQRLVRERLARDALAELRRLVGPPRLVDVLAEPAQEPAELALLDVAHEVRHRLVGGVPELGAVEVAEGVGGEVA